MSLGKQAKILSKKQELAVLNFIETSRHPLRNKVMFLLSIKAGLRAKEIASLTWEMLTDPDGNISAYIHLIDAAAKGKSGRQIPINSHLKLAVEQLMQDSEITSSKQTVLLSERKQPFKAKVIVNWFKKLYLDLGFTGCSSHSGRRTFVTRAAEQIIKAGGTLRDVQELAGHSSLHTTQRYIEANSKARRDVVDLI